MPILAIIKGSQMKTNKLTPVEFVDRVALVAMKQIIKLDGTGRNHRRPEDLVRHCYEIGEEAFEARERLQRKLRAEESQWKVKS